MKYTMHNIVLPDGAQTIPGKPILADTPDVKSMIAFAQQFGFKRIIDLGAGEGGYSIAFARAGFDVTAVEAREENCMKIRHALCDLANVDIKRVTVEDYMAFSYDPFPKGAMVLCLGLLYHLPNPEWVLACIARGASGMILSTHYALEDHWQYDDVPAAGSWLLKRICKRLPWLFRCKHFGLSKITTHKGRRGRWYPEYHPKEKDISHLTHSSYHNSKSFWLTSKEIFAICSENNLPSAWGRIKESQQNILAYFITSKIKS